MIDGDLGLHRDRLADLERMLVLLDGKPVPDNRADTTRRLSGHIHENSIATVTKTTCLRSNTFRRERHISFLSDRNWSIS